MKRRDFLQIAGAVAIGFGVVVAVLAAILAFLLV